MCLLKRFQWNLCAALVEGFCHRWWHNCLTVAPAVNGRVILQDLVCTYCLCNYDNTNPPESCHLYILFTHTSAHTPVHSVIESHVCVKLQCCCSQNLHLRVLVLQAEFGAKTQDEASLRWIQMMLILCIVDISSTKCIRLPTPWIIFCTQM